MGEPCAATGWGLPDMNLQTITIGELFTEQQLRQAAAIMKNCPTPHDNLVQMLTKTGLRKDVLPSYAAYILEWKREDIIKAYS